MRARTWIPKNTFDIHCQDPCLVRAAVVLSEGHGNSHRWMRRTSIDLDEEIATQEANTTIQRTDAENQHQINPETMKRTRQTSVVPNVDM